MRERRYFEEHQEEVKVKDFFELREAKVDEKTGSLQKVTDVEFNYRDQLPNSPKTSDLGAIKDEWRQDRIALRDAVKKMDGLITNTIAPSRGNKWVGTVTISTRGDASKLDDKSIQKAVKSHGIEIHDNQFRESTDLTEDKQFTIKVPKGGPRGKDYVTKVSGKDQKSVVAKWRKENPKYKNDTIDVQQLAVLKKKGGKYSFTKESVDLTEAVVSRADFDKIKKGDVIEVVYDSSMKKNHKAKLKVKSKTRSAKYDVDKVNMVDATDPRNKTQFTFFSRQGKDATLGWGGMGVVLKSYKIGVKESLEEGAENYTVKKGPFTRKVDGKTADKMKRQGWKLVARESVELDEKTTIDIARDVVKNKSAKHGLDMQTANLILKVYDKVNDVNKKKMEKMNPSALGQAVWKMTGK